MKLFSFADPFQIVPGSAPIAVGAPHHGTRPNAKADLGTGPIALALARQLGGRAVVVSDLRSAVDVNKAPLRLDDNVRRHAIRYQNELFHGLPRLVIEIHGHMDGQYDVEVTIGFDLDAAIPGDARLLTILRTLKETLPEAIASQVGRRPSVGIYPLDQDVRAAATGTFTFQKIRRARNLVGLEWFGLHIELNPWLRTSQTARSSKYASALGAAFEEAIRSAFGSELLINNSLPNREDPVETRCDPAGSLQFTALPVPRRYIHQTLIFLSPGDLEALGARDGERLILCNGGETIQSPVSVSQTLHARHAAIPARLRRQISLDLYQQVRISRIGARVSPDDPTNSSAYLVLKEICPGRTCQTWISPGEIERLGLVSGKVLWVNDQPAGLLLDPTMPPCLLAISRALARSLTCTIGEVLTITKGNRAQ